VRAGDFTIFCRKLHVPMPLRSSQGYLTWYITWCGCTSVESMHVASSPVQTSSGQQPMDLADYLSVKIHLVVSQFLELVLEAVNGIYLDCWLLQTVPAISDVRGEAKAGKLCT